MTSITVITGANKGLGFETARRLIAAGHTVYAGARHAHRGELAAHALGARPLLIDVTDEASVAAAADQVRAEAGRVDVLVNNAGIAGPAAPAGELNATDLQQVFDTNVFGAVRTTRAFLSLLQQAARPAIVNVSSALGSLTINADPAAHSDLLPAWAPLLAYNSSKAALNMLTVVYAQSLPQISVVSVDPGFTATDLNGHQGTQSVEEGAAAIVTAATAAPGTPSPAFVGATGPVPW
ncbi:SDR family NAD(P)-dependent oxidoreductase [Myceligenerans xiligouense]|uniref:NADP-dependent 3-hydroxy acid dehydrogenase YdfG n=1 Tax=Myceligenerans xiligouense TaxID=253184 RepID=A0A3N4YQX0_9MICO|nr:SDR family NAD(P)-dependent oxidoreductase [Myceligenerans xiligouense]RPF21906.1 NADP-dependent 3-hydroxy acid dehydrogenase YdfG [Myceligenerans xiligouense]